MMNSHHSLSHLELPYSPPVSLATGFSNGFGVVKVGEKHEARSPVLVAHGPFGLFLSESDCHL